MAMVEDEESYFMRKAQEAREHRETGNAARLARINAGVKVKDIAALLHVGEARIYRFERGESISDYELFERAHGLAVKMISERKNTKK